MSTNKTTDIIEQDMKYHLTPNLKWEKGEEAGGEKIREQEG